MSRFSAQLKLDLCLIKTVEGKWKFGGYHDVNGKKVSFSDVVITHQDYFKEVACGTKRFKFRDAAHAEDKKLIEAVRIEVVRMYAREIIGNPNLKGNLELLSRFSGIKEITTPKLAFQALMECNLKDLKTVLARVTLK